MFGFGCLILSAVRVLHGKNFGENFSKSKVHTVSSLVIWWMKVARYYFKRLVIRSVFLWL